MRYSGFLYGKEKEKSNETKKTFDTNYYYWIGLAVLLFLIGLWYLALILLALVLVLAKINPKPREMPI
ncbi:Uncharacterised protein [uncultured archaeon]|nr:Uncharacterised protein [uncultured archaeon]